MNHRLIATLPRTALAVVSLTVFSVPTLRAQTLPPAAGGATVESTPISQDRLTLATNLISESLRVANDNPQARITALRGAAALIPRLASPARDTLTDRWLSLALAPDIQRTVRGQALSSFFDVAAHQDPEYAAGIAGRLPDAAGRAAGFLSLSEAYLHRNWDRSNEYLVRAQQAARQEDDPSLRARSLTFVAQQVAIVNPDLRADAVREASTAVRRTFDGYERDYLLSEVVTAAAKFDLPIARRIAGDIQDQRLQGLAQARANLSEISQTTLSNETSERVAKLAQAAVRYDQRALPILLQLPATPESFKAISDALPGISPTAAPSMNPMLLERIWKIAESAQPSVYRDQLQSRLARLMVLQDLWRGRAWGKSLSWQGGRVQVGAFLKQVIEYRQSALKIEPLQDVAQNNVQRAVREARALPPIGRVEALLLIAGQVLG